MIILNFCKNHTEIFLYDIDPISNFIFKKIKSIIGGAIQVKMLLYADSFDANFKSLRLEYEKAAKAMRGRVIFVYVNTALNIVNQRMIDLLGWKKKHGTTVRLMKMGDDMKKYRPSFNELTSENIIQFAQDYFDGKLKPYLLKQVVPQDWDAKPVKILTGKNFEEVVRDSTKTVLVYFYSPWVERWYKKQIEIRPMHS